MLWPLTPFIKGNRSLFLNNLPKGCGNQDNSPGITSQKTGKCPLTQCYQGKIQQNSSFSDHMERGKHLIEKGLPSYQGVGKLHLRLASNLSPALWFLLHYKPHPWIFSLLCFYLQCWPDILPRCIKGTFFFPFVPYGIILPLKGATHSPISAPGLCWTKSHVSPCDSGLRHLSIPPAASGSLSWTGTWSSQRCTETWFRIWGREACCSLWVWRWVCIRSGASAIIWQPRGRYPSVNGADLEESQATRDTK